MLVPYRVTPGSRLLWGALGILAVVVFALRPASKPAEAVVPPPAILTQTFSGTLNVKLGPSSVIPRPVTVTVKSQAGLGSVGGYNGDITEVVLSTNVVPTQGDLRFDTRTAGWLRQVGATSKFTLNTPSTAAGEVYVNSTWRQLKKTSSITTVTAKFTNGGSRLQLTISGQALNGTTNIAVEGSIAATGLDAAPILVSTVPENGSGNNSVATTVKFIYSEPVTAPASAFTLTCGAVPVTFTLNDSPNSNVLELVPTSAFPPGGSCTATVNNGQVSDEDSIDPPDLGSGIESITFTLDLPPSVVGTEPNALSPMQATDTNIVITFSEPVNYTASSFVLDCGGGPIAFVLNASPATVVTLNPTVLLPAGASCLVTVLGNLVSDVDALDPPDTMAANYLANFFTDAAPALVSVDPDGTTVASDRQVVITFSEPITLDPGALSITCGASPQAIVPGVVGDTVTIPAPGGGWPTGTTCSLSGDQTKIHDADSADPPDALTSNIAKSFSIDAAPSVLSTVPTNGQSGFSTNANLVVNFSEAVDVAAGGMTLACDSTPITVTGIPATNTTQVTLQHVAPLGVNCTLTILASGVTDADAIDPPNNLSADVIITFVTDVPPTAVDDSATVTEDASATAINVLANDTDTDGGPKSITSVTQPANGTVVITGGGTGVNYTPNPNYCNTPPGTTLDTFTYTLTPGGSTGTVFVTVTCVDDNPVAVNNSATVGEDSGATGLPVLPNDTDVDGGPISIASVTQPANGTVVITGGGTGLTYQPNSNYCNTPPGTTLDTFTYTLTPGGSTATVTVTVTCVDDFPVAVADSATVLENDSATAINVLVNDTDVDGGPKSITSVTQPANGTVVITGGGTGLTYAPNPDYCNDPPGTTLDTFTYTLTPGGSSTTVTVTVTCFDDPPVAVADSATVTEDSGANAIDVLTNDTDPDGGPKSIASVTQPANGTVVITGGGTGLTYAPNAEYCNNPPGTTLDTFTYSLSPAGPTPTATVTMTVTCVNDAPTAVAAAHDVTGNVSITVSAPGLRTGALDQDDSFANLVAELVNLPANSGTLTVNPDGSYTYDPPAGVFSGTIVATFRICDDESPTPACSAATNLTFTLSEGAFFVNNNAGACSSDCDGRLSHPFTSLASFQAVNNNTGNNPGNNDSIFIYESATAYTGGVTLLPGQKLIGQDASATLASLAGITLAPDSAALPVTNTEGGAVTLTSSANVVTLGTNNLVRGMTIGDSGTGAKIHGVNFGTLTVGNTTTPDVTLNGNGRALKLETGALAATSAFASVTSATNPSATDQSLRLISLTGSLAMGSTTVTTSNIQAIFVNQTTADINFGNTSIDGTTTQEAIRIESNTGGTRTFGTLGITNAAGIGLVSGGASGGGNVNVTGLTTITNPGTYGINIGALATGTTNAFAGVTVTGSGGTAISLSDNVGNVSFGDLNLTPDSGQGGIAASGANSGSITSTNVGSTGITTTNAPAINMSTTGSDTTVNMSFDTVNVTGGGVAANGIRLDNTTGTVSVLGGAISETSGADVSVSSGAMNLTYDGTITDDTGALVSVASETGGTKDFNGAITDGNDGDGSGISLTSNSGATIRFDGGLTLSTGANAAFAATGGGTVIVTDPASGANTITTTTGTALNVANTFIGSAGLTFESISANGATNGIILNTTGTAAGTHGGLSVTGTGTTDGSGGVIQSTSNRGASFISTRDVSLKNMNFTNAGTSDLDADNSGLSTGDNLSTNAAIHLQTVTNATIDNVNISGGAEQGINGNTVSNFVLSNSSIDNVGNGPDEDSIHFFNMSGTSSITSTTLNCSAVICNTGNNGGGDDHLNLQMTSGTLVLTITGGSATRANNGAGYLFGIRGTANATLNITSGSSTNNFGGGIVADAFDTAVMDLNVTGTTSSGNNDQLSVSAGDSSDVDLVATGNTLSSVTAGPSGVGDFAVVGLTGSAFDTGFRMDATISNNTISTANGVLADGIVVFNAGGGIMNTLISNNTISYGGTQRVLLAQYGQDGNGTNNLTVTQNSVTITATIVAGFLVQSAITGPGNTSSLCADIGGAGALSNTFIHSGGAPGAAGDVRVRQRNDGTMRLPGYAGGATDTAAVVAYLAARNTIITAATATFDSTGFAGGGACTLPS